MPSSMKNTAPFLSYSQKNDLKTAIFLKLLITIFENISRYVVDDKNVIKIAIIHSFEKNDFKVFKNRLTPHSGVKLH